MKALEKKGWLDVRNNYIGCEDPEAAMNDIQILIERIGENFLYEPQRECPSGVKYWDLY